MRKTYAAISIGIIKRVRTDLVSIVGTGENLPMEITINIDAERQLIVSLLHLPFIVLEDKRLNFAIATSIAFYRLVDGSFDYDIARGIM